MSSPLNTFTVVLLAFPFYLAQRKRLAAYIDLAKPSKGSQGSMASVGSTTPPSSDAAAGKTASTADATSGGLQALAGLTSMFTGADSTALFS